MENLLIRVDREGKKIILNGNENGKLCCDLEWTSEAIGNLIKNALDHTDYDGLIKIEWKQTPGMMRLIISDNGSGISEEDIHYIFKRFYRSRYSNDQQGIGLGLPLAKAIIEGQGGIISVQSIYGEWTTFIITFLTDV